MFYEVLLKFSFCISPFVLQKTTTTGIEIIILKNTQNTTGKNSVINLEVTFERRSVLLAFYNMFHILIS